MSWLDIADLSDHCPVISLQTLEIWLNNNQNKHSGQVRCQYYVELLFCTKIKHFIRLQADDNEKFCLLTLCNGF